MARIDWGAIRAGAAVSLAVLVLAMLAMELADRTVGIGARSNWVFVFYAVAFTGLAVGGAIAARRRPDAALTHGVLAALAAYAVVALLDALVAMVSDTWADPVALAFNALMAASAGTLGTLVAERRSGPAASPEADAPSTP